MRRKMLKLSLLLVCVAVALVIMLLSASVYTFNVLTAETLIAELRFDRTGDRQYLAHLRTGDRCDERMLPVLGEQWRVDAEFLKWKYWAMLFGLDSQYRLERLEGRYRSAAEQNTAPKLSHDLHGGTAIDVVDLAGALGSWNFLIDATYGSSTYQDIDTANVYYVYRTTTGIITRSAPRSLAAQSGAPGAALEVDVNRACGGKPPVWERMTTWTDDRVVDALGLDGGD
jgi:hypothetical protein